MLMNHMLSWIFVLLVIGEYKALKLLSFMRKLEKLYNIKGFIGYGNVLGTRIAFTFKFSKVQKQEQCYFYQNIINSS